MKIFVAKLDYSITDADLEHVFKDYGEVESAKVIMDRETGRSRGFGFVEMPNDEEAQAAIDELDGAELEGREVVVKKAEDRKDGGGGRRGGGYGGGRGGGRGGYGGGGGRGGYDRY